MAARALDRARAGLIVRTGVLFEEAAEEWLRYAVEDRACKPSTMQDYRHTCGDRDPTFGD